jgi:hypothetical protein
MIETPVSKDSLLFKAMEPSFLKLRRTVLPRQGRRNGDRFEYRRAGARMGYFYILPPR